MLAVNRALPFMLKPRHAIGFYEDAELPDFLVCTPAENPLINRSIHFAWNWIHRVAPGLFVSQNNLKRHTIPKPRKLNTRQPDHFIK